MGEFDDLIPEPEAAASVGGAFDDLIPKQASVKGTFNDLIPARKDPTVGEVAFDDFGRRVGTFNKAVLGVVPSTLRIAGAIEHQLGRPLLNRTREEYESDLALWKQTRPEDAALSKVGNFISDKLTQLNPPLAEPDVWDNTVQGAGQMAGMLAGGGVLKLAGASLPVVTAGASTMGGIQEFDDAYQRSRERGDDPDTAFAKSLGYATVATMIENKLGAGRLLRQIIPDPSLVAKKLTALGVSKTVAGNFIAGGLEEGSQRWAQNLMIEGKPSMEGVMDEAIPGAIVQGIAGAPGGVSERLESDARYRQEQAFDKAIAAHGRKVALEASLPRVGTGENLAVNRPKDASLEVAGAFDDLIPKQSSQSQSPRSSDVLNTELNNKTSGAVTATDAVPGASTRDQIRAGLSQLPGAEQDLTPEQAAAPATKGDLVKMVADLQATLQGSAIPANPVAQPLPNAGEYIRDAAGNPKELWHATKSSEEVKAFNPFSHFGSKQQAEKIPGAKRIGKSRLKMRNPLRVHDVGMPSPERFIYNVPQLKKLDGPWVSAPANAQQASEMWAEIRTELESQGYDGMVYLNKVEGVKDTFDDERMTLTDDELRQRGAEDSYIIFRPEQVDSYVSEQIQPVKKQSSSPQGTGTEMSVQPQPASVGGRAAGAAVEYHYDSPESKAWWEKLDELNDEVKAKSGTPEVRDARKRRDAHDDLAFGEGGNKSLAKRRIDKSNPLKEVGNVRESHFSASQIASRDLTGWRFNGDWKVDEDGNQYRAVIGPKGEKAVVDRSLHPLQEQALERNTSSSPQGTGTTAGQTKPNAASPKQEQPAPPSPVTPEQSSPVKKDIFDEVQPEPGENEMDYGSGGQMPRTSAVGGAGNETVKYPQYVYRARKLMERKFAGMKRQAGDAASDHINRVADMTDDPIVKAVAYLHDIVEDTPTTIEEIRRDFGDTIAEAVDAETWRRTDGETYEHYIERLMKNDVAAKSKLKDLADNIEFVGKFNTEKSKAKVKLWTETAERLQRKLAGLPDITHTINKKWMPDGVTERNIWEQKQIHKVVDTALFPPAGKKPVIAFTGGGAAAGKSTIIGMMHESKALHDDVQLIISADDYKTGEGSVEDAKAEGIPEFQALKNDRPDAAYIVHKESTKMAKATLARVVNEGKSAAYDATMSDAATDWVLAKAALDAGHDVELIGVYLEQDEAVKRADARAKKTGRHVLEKFVREGHIGFAKSFPTYLENFPRIFLWDNNRYKDPRLIIRKDENGIEILDPEAYIKFAGKEAYEAAKQLQKSQQKRVGVTPPSESADPSQRQPDDGQGGRESSQESQSDADTLAGELTNDDRSEQGGDGRSGTGRSQSATVGAPGDDGGTSENADGSDTSVQSSISADDGQEGQARTDESGGSNSSDADGVSTESGSDATNADATGSGGARGGSMGGRTTVTRNQPVSTRPNLRLKSSPAPTGGVARIKANIAAIKIVRSLEESKKDPTPEEIATLSQWSGWGSFKELFNSGKAERRDYDQSWAQRYGKFYDQLRDVLTDEEFNSAAYSSVNAHYTGGDVVRFGWDVARRLGFTGGRVLDPSFGGGAYEGYQPDDLHDASQFTAIELDQITGKIASYLYPASDVRIQGFQDAKLPNGYFDIAMSNVPFHQDGPGAEYPQLNLHNYFIARMLDKVKPGGLVIAITTHNTMDAREQQREFLAAKGEFVGAIRLPNNAFKDSAATEVVTDMMVFRKPDGKPFDSQRWASLVNVAQVSKDQANPNPEMWVNEYFAANPHMVLGKHATTGSMHKEDEYTVVASGALQPKLDAAIASFPEGLMKDVARTDDVEMTGLENFTLQIRDGHVVEALGFKLNMPRWDSSSPTLVETAKRYIAVRDVMRAQFVLERSAESTPEAIEAGRKQLVKTYTALTKQLAKKGEKRGYLLLNKTKLKHLRDDPYFQTVMALEVETLEKNDTDPSKNKKVITGADILSKRVLKPQAAPSKADNAADALAISMSYKGAIDMPYMQSLTGKSVEDISNELIEKNLAYFDPDTARLADTHEYLTGDVRTKLAIATFAAKEDARIERNVRDLKAVIPPDDKFATIKYGIEGRWIPTTIHNSFAAAVMGLPDDIVHFVPKIENFAVRGSERINVRSKNYGSGIYGMSDRARADWSTPDRSAMELLEAALNNKRVRVMVAGEKKGSLVENTVASESANKKVDRIREEFIRYTRTTDAKVTYRRFDSVKGQYVTEPMPIGDVMEAEWNKRHNSYIVPDWDGSALVLPDASDWIYRKPHFLNGIQRGLQAGNVYYAHGVGSGKTPLIICLANELKRIGLAKKPVIVAKKPTTEQFRRTIEAIYPGKKILIPDKTDFEKDNRKRIISRIATGDYDFIVLTHEQLKSIRPSEAAVKAFFDEHIGALRDTLIKMGHANAENAKSTRGMSREVSNLVRAIKSAEKRLNKQLESLKKHHDGGMPWEELGIDAILLDEAHNFKKMPFATELDVKGVPSDFSQRAVDLLVKLRDVHRRTNGRNAYFFSGTPVSNTLAEIWLGIYATNPKLLQSMNLGTFDAFATAFADITSNFEFGWDNKFKVVTRMSKFKNGRGLTTLTRLGMDVRIGNEELGLDVPKLAGGGPQIVTTPVNPEFQRWLDMLEDIADTWADLEPKERWENSWVPIAAMRAGAAAAIDPRLVFTDALDHPDSKLNKTVERIMEEYTAGTPRRTTMMVFCDLYRTMNTDKLRSFLGGDHDQAAAVTTGPEQSDLSAVVGDKETEDAETEEASDTGSKDEADYLKNAVGTFNIYDELRNKLVAKGVPRHEIAIATEHDTDVKRNDLFDKVRSGQVRILIGSTEKIGEGVDVPQRMSYQVHMDPPMQMTPAKQEQRNGRLIRQGNLHSPKHWNIPVRIDLMAQENSMDAPISNMLLSKTKMTIQAMKGQYLGDEFEDPASDLTVALAQMIAQASGDSRSLRLAELTEEVRQLKTSEQAHLREVSDFRSQRDSNERDEKQQRKYAAQHEAFAKAASKAIPSPEKLTLKIDGVKDQAVGEKAAREAIRALATEITGKLVKKGDTQSRMIHFGGDLYALLKGTREEVEVRDENTGKIVLTKDGQNLTELKNFYSTTYTHSATKPKLEHGNFDLNLPIRRPEANEGLITGALRLVERAEADFARNLRSADEHRGEVELWGKKLSEAGKFEKADLLAEKDKELAKLQKEVMSANTKYSNRAIRKARGEGLLFPARDKNAVMTDEQAREALRGEIGELETVANNQSDKRISFLEQQLDQLRAKKAMPINERPYNEQWRDNDWYDARIEEKEQEIKEVIAERAADRADRAGDKISELASIENKMLAWLDAQIKATDFDQTKTLEGVLGAPVWMTKGALNVALRAVRAAIKAGKSISEAIRAGVAAIKAKNIKGFDEAEAEKFIEAEARKNYTDSSPEASDWTSLQQRISDAQTELKDAIRQHMNPPEGMTKAKALRAKNAAHRKLLAAIGEQLKQMTSLNNLDAARSPEQTADMISQTVDLLNSIQDEITERKAQGKEVGNDLSKLRVDLQARLMMLKGWADDQTETEARKPKPTTTPGAATVSFRELESATDPEQKTFGEWWQKVKTGLRYLTNPIPELSLTGPDAQKSALFRRGYRLFAVENNRVRKEAAEKVDAVLEPLTKLGRKPASNEALKQYYRLGEALQRAKMDAGKTKLIQARMKMLEETHLNKDPFNLFRRLVLYRDLWWRGTFLKNDQGDPITLPMGLTIEDVAGQLRGLTKAIEEHPDGLAIVESLKRHYALTDELQKSILEHGEIIPESLRNPLYFPHHIIDSWTGRLDRVRPTTEEDFRRYLIAPVGSGKLIQTDYLKAMYLHTADVLAHNARVDLVQKYWQSYDISEQLKKQHGKDWSKPWNIPPGFKVFTPFKKLPLRMDYILTREVLAEKLGVLFNDGDLRQRLGEAGKVLNVKPEDLHAAMVAGEKIQWALPAEIADALNGIARREAAAANPGLGHAIGLPFRAANNFWKKTKLFAPWNWIRYEYGNLSTDAVDKVLAADPATGRYLARAAREVWNADTGEQSPEFKAAVREGVFETITAGEAGELTKLPQFKAFLTAGEARWDKVRTLLESPMRGSKFRESVFRFAKFLADVERLRAGKHPVYAGAFHGDIVALGEDTDGIRRPLSGDDLLYAKAAEISLKTYGDYNSLSVAGQWLRQYAVPFWSWQDVNFRYHANQIRNIADGIRGVKGATDRQTALRYAALRVVTTLIAVGLAKELWNQFGGVMAGLWDDDDDLEASLSEADRRRGHIIVGKDKNGQAMVVYTPSAWSDVAEWTGGQNMKRLFMEYARGQITLEQFITDYAKQLPKDVINKAAQSAGPLGKAPYELASGKATFPDVLDQRSIPDADKWWRLVGTMTDDRAVNVLRSAFDRDYYSQPATEQLQQIILQVRRRDPEQWAYFEAREDAADWKEKRTGKRFEQGSYNAPEAQALRNFRKSIYRGDVASAERFYGNLLEYGYTAERLDASIRNQHPLADLNVSERAEYTKALTERQRRELELATKYYKRLSALDGREKQLFPKKGQQPRPNPELLRQMVKDRE